MQGRQTSYGDAERTILEAAGARAAMIVQLCGEREMRFEFQVGHYAPSPVDGGGSHGPAAKYAVYKILNCELLATNGDLPVDSSPEIAARFLKECAPLLVEIERQLDDYRRTGGV